MNAAERMTSAEQDAMEFLVKQGLMRVTHILDHHYRVWGKTPLFDQKRDGHTFTEDERKALEVLYG